MSSNCIIVKWCEDDKGAKLISIRTLFERRRIPPKNYQIVNGI